VGVEPEVERDLPDLTKRVTIPISEEVHTRIKVACAARRLRMVDVLRGWVETGLTKMEAA
jgi:hypothetical protein